MAFLNTRERYGSLSIGLHWLMFLLLVAVYFCAEMRGFFPKGSRVRADFMAWHFSLGVSVFFLAMVRLIARLFTPEPVIVPDILIWQKWLAKLMHYSLYLLMIGMPILGYSGLNAAGKKVHFFGIGLPDLIQTNKALARTIFDVHETIGTIGYFLIGVHALAALFHHYIQGDNTLIRMWFKRR
ncbi:MAG: cytochrome b561 [Solimicrobium sp.]|jgi:cytochrome b561|nr:cytochrome b561 [Solimicrobium sp.]